MVLKFSPCPDFFICSTKRFLPDEKHVTRRYGKSVLILMWEGELSFIEDGKLITLTRGEYYIQPNGLFQQGVPLSAPPIYFFVEFSGSFSNTSAFGLPQRGRFNPQTMSALTERLEQLYKQQGADLFKLNSYMLRIFSELTETTSAESRHKLSLPVRNFIDSQFSSKITMADISREFGYNEDYISRIFKEHYGITPHQHLSNLRMEHARWLLESTDMPVEQIATAVGYTDFSAFYRSFKKVYRISPGSVRVKKAENET